MPAFAYQGPRRQRQTAAACFRAIPPRAVRASLRERGLTPLEVTPAERPGGAAASGAAGLALRNWPCSRASSPPLLGAGLPIDEALGALAEQGGDERARALTVGLRARVMEGRSGRRPG